MQSSAEKHLPHDPIWQQRKHASTNQCQPEQRQHGPAMSFKVATPRSPNRIGHVQKREDRQNVDGAEEAKYLNGMYPETGMATINMLATQI